MNARKSGRYRRREGCFGFTLIELLVVMSVIAIMAGAWFGGLNGGVSAKLQSAQLMMTNLVTNARGLAQGSGRRTRLLVHADGGEVQPAGRFLRFVALQQRELDGVTWTTVRTAMLPEETYVVPLSPRAFSGLVSGGDGAANDWTRPSVPGTELGSTLFDGSSVGVDLRDGAPAASFQGVQFTERGTLAKLDGSGVLSGPTILLLVAAGRTTAPEARAAGASPVELIDANKVRGVFLSQHAVPILVNDKESL